MLLEVCRSLQVGPWCWKVLLEGCRDIPAERCHKQGAHPGWGLVSSTVRESEPVGDCRWPAVEVCQGTEVEIVCQQAGRWYGKLLLNTSMESETARARKWPVEKVLDQEEMVDRMAVACQETVLEVMYQGVEDCELMPEEVCQ